MFLFTNFSNIFFQEHSQVTAAEPLKQLYHPIILARDREWKNEKIVFLSHSELVRLGLLYWLFTGISDAY